MMETAPSGLRNGWFYSHLGFYDLQKMLIKETTKSAIIALVIIFFIMMFVTTNISLTVITISTIFLINCTTVALLILLGWHLNVFESIITTICISLSVHFSQHYTIEYQTSCEDSPRATAISRALFLIAYPSIMGAITTVISGTFMLSSVVMPFTHLGMFLIAVMAISWIYSTFFLLSFISLFGYGYGNGPCPYRCCRKLKKKYSMNVRYKRCTRQASLISNVGSESTLSCINSNILNQSNTHEMETLTVDSLKCQPSDIKNTSSCLYLSIDDNDDDEYDIEEINNVHI